MDLDPLKGSEPPLVVRAWTRLSGHRRRRPAEPAAPSGAACRSESPGGSAAQPACPAPSPGPRPWRRGLTVGIAAALLAGLVVGVMVAPAVSADRRDRSRLSAQPVPPSTEPSVPPMPAATPAQADPPAGPGPATAKDLDLSSSPTAAPSTVGVPTLVDIPAIGVHASITPLGLGAHGIIQVPDQFGLAGWYDGGPRPGDSGPAVLLGHVDSQTGPAVFLRLKDLHPGDTVTVTSSTGTVSFIVDSVAEYPKTAFPTAAVYGPVSDRALRLVTCGGKFDDSRHSYLSNVIVFATAAG